MSVPGEPTDAELVASAAGGDQGAFGTLVKRHERRVYNLAFRMLGREEDARDATQDAFLSCFRRLKSFRGDAAFSTWLHRIAVNASYDVLRKRKHEPLMPGDLPEPRPAPDHGDRAVAAVDVQRALSAVPMEFRAVLVLHDLLGQTFEDVAEALELPIGTVKSRLHRGRVAMGRALGAAEPRSAGPAGSDERMEPADPSPPSNPGRHE